MDSILKLTQSRLCGSRDDLRGDNSDPPNPPDQVIAHGGVIAGRDESRR